MARFLNFLDESLCQAASLKSEINDKDLKMGRICYSYLKKVYLQMQKLLMSFVCLLPPVCQFRGQGWGEVHDPG